jgi:hypothetical protein
MRILKYIKLFEEVELSLSELEKERVGVKRGTTLIKKLEDPLVKLNIKGKGERTIDHIKVDNQEVVPSVAAKLLKTSGTDVYDNKKGSELFGKPRYKDVFVSGEEEFKLNQVTKTPEFGAVGPGVLTRKYEAIQCLFIAFKLRFPRLHMDKEQVINFWEKYVRKDVDTFKKIGIYLDPSFELTREVIDSLSTNQDWFNTFMKVPELLMGFKGMFSPNGTKKYSIFLESNKDVESPICRIVKKYNSIKLKNKSNVNFSKFCPADVYIVLDRSLSEINKKIDSVENLDELVVLLDTYFDRNELIPISLKKLKDGDKIIINKEIGRKLPDFRISRFVITDDPLRGIGSKIKTRSTWISETEDDMERGSRDIVFDSSDTNKAINIDGDISGHSSRHGKITFNSIKSILKGGDHDFMTLYGLNLDSHSHLVLKTNDELRKELLFTHDDLKSLVPNVIIEIKTTTNKGLPNKMYTDLSKGSSESSLKNKLISKLQSLQLLRALAIIYSEETTDSDYVITKIMRYALSIQTELFDSTPRYLRII